MKALIYKYTLLLLLLIPLDLYSQEYDFKNYQVDAGLSHNSITSSIQDHKGFMWFGTKDGLNRFDGYEFKTFPHLGEDKSGLGNNYISILYEYRNNIWIGTNQGLYLYEENLDRFQLIPGTADLRIIDIISDANENIWYVSPGTIYKIDSESYELVQTYTIPHSRNILTDCQGHIWISDNQHIFRYIPSEDTFEKVPFNEGSTAPGFDITRVHPTSSCSLLIGTTTQGAYSYEPTTGQLLKLLPGHKGDLMVRDFLETENEIWCATESGIFVYNKANQTYINLQKNYNDLYSLTDNAIYCLTQDREGGIWAGTYFGGINYHPPSFTPFKKYYPKKGENSISGNAVREIHEDQYGAIWIGTEDAGINKFNPSTGKFESFLNDVNYSGIRAYNIHGILPMGNEIWVGTFQNGIQVLDIVSGDLLREYRTGELLSNFVKDIYLTESKEVFILTSRGIQTYDPKSDSFTVHPEFPLDIHYNYVTEDDQGTIWAGSSMYGLYYYNAKTKKGGVLQHNPGDTSSLSSNYVNGLFLDSENTMWVTTESGLNRLHRKDHSFQRYSTTHGLPSNVTFSLLEDRNKNLWITTSKGLAVYEPASEKFETYTKSNGLLSDQFNYSSAYKSSENRLYFGSVFGMISFDPEEFVDNNFNGPSLFTGVLINNQEVAVHTKNAPLKKSITFSDGLVLNHLQRTFSLTLSNLSYTAPAMTEYFYHMKGLDKNWYSLGKSHTVTFTQLPPGDYILKVMSKNNYGTESEISELPVVILAPWWMRWWAYLVYIALLIGVVLLLLRYYHHYTKNKSLQEIAIRESRKEKEMLTAKIDFFTNVAHEIRTPLTLIKAPLEKLLVQEKSSLKTKQLLKIMDTNTTRLLELVNELLDFRKAETENLKLSFTCVCVSNIIAETMMQFSPLISEKNLKLSVNTPAQKIYANLDEKAFRKILSNLFNNAIKYSSFEIFLEMRCEEENVIIDLSNDGRTIPEHLSKKIFEPFYRISDHEDQPGTGMGLSLARSLTELHGGTLKYRQHPNSINLFTLSLPTSHQQNPLEKQLVSSSEGTSWVTSGTKSQIVIVEDNQDLLNFIGDDLEDDYSIHKTQNGKEALDFIKTHKVQLVISDVLMPEINGLELCQLIKNNIETSHIPIILLSAKDALNSQMEGLEEGADAYITKPFSMEHLKVQVKSLLENRKHIMDAYSYKPLAHLSSIAQSGTESEFIRKLDEIIIANIANTELSVELIAEKLHMSRATLYRKINDISNLTPNELINVTRMKKAAQLLLTKHYKIFEVADMTGYKTQSSFGRNFQKQFHMSPSEYIKQMEDKNHQGRNSPSVPKF